MQGIEFVLILCGFSAAILLLVGFSGTLNDAMKNSSSILAAKSESEKCAFLADLVYANGINELGGEKFNCIIIDGIASASNADANNSRHSILLNKKTKTIFSNGKTKIKVNSDGHYR